MSDAEDTTCPLCMEEMDLIDRNFVPCPCGYRVCMWCWHHIRENLNGLCPACRVPYKEDPHAFAAVDSTEVVKKNKERKQKEKQDRKVTDRPATTKIQPIDRKHLHNYRVVQRNLVYIIGVPGSIASEEILRRAEYFGQYGRINKVVVHRNHTSSHATVSAYITFAFKDDAKAAIQALEGFWLEGHQVRASFGTTKYCNNFIRGVPCNNPDCVYLHELGEDEDRFTKEEIQAGYSKLLQQPGRDQTIVTGAGGPSGTGKRCSGEPTLPPPVFVQDVAIAERNSKRSSGGLAPSRESSSGNISAVAVSGGMGEDTESEIKSTVSSNPQSSHQSDSSPQAQQQTQQQQQQQLSKSKKGDMKASSGQESGNGGESSSSKLPSQQQKSATVKPASSGGNILDEKSKSKAAVSEKDSKARPQKGLHGEDGNGSGMGEGKVGGSSMSEQKPVTTNTSTSEGSRKAQLGNGLDAKSKDTSTTSSESSSSSTDGATANTSTGHTAAQSLSGLVSAASFNGLGNCAVFPVPVSSLSMSIWSNLAKSSSDDLKMNPYALITIPVTELFELTIPPVDAACLTIWPKPLSHYSQGVGANGVTSAPAGQHTFYRPSSYQQLPAGDGSSSSGSSGSGSVAPALAQPNQQPNQQQQQAQQLFQQQQQQYMSSNGSTVGGGGGAKSGQQPPTMAALQQMFPGVNMAFGPPKGGQPGQQQQPGYGNMPSQR